MRRVAGNKEKLVKHAPYGLTALLLLGAVGFAPRPAQASEIEFYVTVDLGFDRACIRFNGPWSRSSGPVRLAGGRRQLAYSVEINSFSPIGEWEVQSSTAASSI